MTAIDSINKFDLGIGPHALKQAAAHQSENKKEEQGSSVDPLLLAYLEIFHSVQINHETASIQAKEVQSNAVAQNNLVNQEAGINFSTVSQTEIDKHAKGTRNAFLQSLNTHNQEISALRNDLGDKLTVLKQDAQVSETNVNTVMNENQQCISESSSLMNMLVSLSNQVSQI